MNFETEPISHWLFDPTVGKIISAIVGIFLIFVITKLSKRYIVNKIKDSENRYRAKKATTFLSYVVTIIVLGVIFSNKLGNLAVALGIAGAGIAFALQEVIVSIAGWLAILAGNFYKTGDRVQLGGITGDVIDIGILRTTIMECGVWVKADQYNGRVVRVANSFVFKEPVYNYSGDFNFLWDEISIPVKYGSDYKLARDLFKRIADEITAEYTKGAKESWDEMKKKVSYRGCSY